MYISVMICDDLEEERAALARMVRQYCQRCALELRLDVASSGEELLDRWTLGQWDLVFLDIFMEGMTGVETARSLRQRGEECALVFATTSQEHGMEGFDLQVMDYLLKPFDQGQLDRTMDWFVQQTADRLRLLRVDMEGEELTIRVGDIDYVEMYRHTAAIHAGGPGVRAAPHHGRPGGRAEGQPVFPLPPQLSGQPGPGAGFAAAGFRDGKRPAGAHQPQEFRGGPPASAGVDAGQKLGPLRASQLVSKSVEAVRLPRFLCIL